MAKKLRKGNDPLGTNPTPMKGVSKGNVDLVLGALKVGSTAVSLMSGLLAAVLILYSGYVLYDSFKTSYGAYTSAWNLLQYKPEIVDDGATPSSGADTLAAINKDYRGWLTIYDSNIDYPVVQGENDLYYASHDIYQNVSLTGAIYLAAANNPDGSDNYNLIYGHHMDNGAMFGQLDSFKAQSFFNAHRTGIWVTKSGVYDLESFAIVTTDAYESQIYTVGNRADKVRAFLEGDRSKDAGLGTEVLIYNKAVADTADRILALSTCASAETNGRVVLFLKMTPRSIGLPDKVKLTIKYVYKDGTQVFRPVEERYDPGTDYHFDSPIKTGYTMDIKIVQGTIWEDTEVIVTYVPIKVTLTVNYVYEDGTEAFPTQHYTYDYGSDYYVRSPQKPGYTMDIAVVQGTITRDTEATVVYVPHPHKLTIRYLYLDGTTAHESYEDVLYPGSRYSVPNPKIEGYTTARREISGIMGGEDTIITVLYVSEDLAENLISIDDLEIPLGLAQSYIQIGLNIE